VWSIEEGSARTMTTLRHRKRPQRTISSLSSSTREPPENVYWLQLELSTSQAIQSALMDRMASVFTMLQDLNAHPPEGDVVPSSSLPDDGMPHSPEASSEHPAVLDFPGEYRTQIEMYERILRTMKNQMHVIQTASDSIIQSLKDHIQELLRDRAALERRWEAPPVLVTPDHRAPLSTRLDGARPPQPPLRHKSIEIEEEAAVLFRDDLQRLREENERLRQQQKEQLEHAEEERRQWIEEKRAMQQEMKRWKRGDSVVWSEEQRQWVQENREAVASCLDRVALLWDKTEESVQTLEGTLIHNSQYRTDADRPSVQEAALALQGQVKVSLMLMEMKLRNNLSLVDMNASFNDDGRVIYAEDLRKELDTIQQQAMAAIEEVEARSNVLIRKLHVQSLEESIRFREIHEAEVAGLRELATRQEILEEEITKMHLSSTEGGGIDHPSERNGSGDILVVDPETVQLLNNEVHRVVERLKEKNVMIGRLQVEIEEHQVRERTLMEELKRYMSEQADQEKLEQERIMQLNAHHPDQYRYEEEEEEESSEEGSSAYEEKTIEGTVDEDEFYELGDEGSQKARDVV
jgi:hypothetical protein